MEDAHFVFIANQEQLGHIEVHTDQETGKTFFQAVFGAYDSSESQPSKTFWTLSEAGSWLASKQERQS